MLSQSMDKDHSNVEVIDLTNESSATIKHNTTITLDDTLVNPVELGSSSDGDEPAILDNELPGSSTPAPIDCDVFSISSSSSYSSSLPSRIPSSVSNTPTPTSTPVKSPQIKLARLDKVSPAKATKSLAKQLAKESRDEAKKLKQKQKEAEKLQKEANRANAANKALDNCTANIDSNVLKLINDPEEIALRTLADESMIKYTTTTYPKVENCISWTYKRSEIENDEIVVRHKEAPWIMEIMEGTEYLERIQAYRDHPDSLRSLKSHLAEVRRRSEMDVILMVFNLASHLRNERLKEAKNYRKTFNNRFGNAGPTTSDQDEIQSVPVVTPAELQELRCMMELQFKYQNPKWKLHIEFYEKTQDIVAALVKYSVSMAKLELKSKVRASTGLDWAINMDKERAVDPTKSSEELTKLWITQLQQFPSITLPIAKAIAAEYPTPFALVDQYKSLSTSEAENCLAELYVQRNLKRQIGQSISKRVYCFMTCRDPDIHIGLS